ncbi:hypothetical protein ACFFIX_05740 [Metabacillus herbersteinensis]|uniref:FbpB family small basic protein n=1 Tax=Metabacillus herbersteinensis TaxID=283816 RepID=A0ABV6GBA1_9BACI
MNKLTLKKYFLNQVEREKHEAHILEKNSYQAEVILEMDDKELLERLK